ncbi:homeobox-leucine zipper protein ATHB-7-like [Mercurialis annua]|uniref:homeobox-leucine zipper protein ATHB-7-like n=1 Tax=Mercurialis annua TaxID=3986 RepID=UPI00215E5028|nr:homeobox-leucine zipper protein ATHB-7-like [Mercurialis annua]
MEINGLFSGMDLGGQFTSGTQKNANRRRFSDEQIKFLEYMFESGSRPEALIKHQLANELGLHPRQVSIWFQNRRARLKNKLVEKEYNKLKASHDALASSFESLKKENQSLEIQLQKLKTVHAKQQENRKCRLDKIQSSSNQRVENRETNYKSKDEPSHHNSLESMLSSTHDSRSTEKAEEETNVFNLAEGADGSLTSSDWSSLDSNGFLDDSGCSRQWWEFLS